MIHPATHEEVFVNKMTGQDSFRPRWCGKQGAARSPVKYGHRMRQILAHRDHQLLTAMKTNMNGRELVPLVNEFQRFIASQKS